MIQQGSQVHNMAIRRYLFGWVAAWTGIVALCAVQPSMAQSLIDGYWNPLLNEDGYAYGGGPDAGDFAGMPITSAGVSVAHTWDPEQAELPIMQCEPYNAVYGFRSLSLLRIWEDRDPYTQQETQIETWMDFAAQHRHIWMVPQPHPPAWALDSWQGYSTGKWVGNVLWVHTDKRKLFQTRAGQPFDDRTTSDERFFRYDDLLIDVMMISDPQYLARPWIYSKMYERVPQGAMAPYLCTPNDEIQRPAGRVPMHLPGNGAQFIDGPIAHGIPVKSALGGPETMYPEYQDSLTTLPANPSVDQIRRAEEKASAEEGAP